MKAIKITKELSSYLNKNNEIQGEIHSTFEGAFNIMDANGNLIGIVSKKKDIGPFSIQINCENFIGRSIEQGNEVLLSGKGIEFLNRKLKIYIDDAELIDLSLEKINQKAKPNKVKQLKEEIVDSGSMNGIAGLIHVIDLEQLKLDDKPLNDYSEFIKGRIKDLLVSLQALDPDLTINHILRIVGFGPGLTPSTDDFLSGVISILYINQLFDEDFYKRVYSDIKGKTTTISETMLKHSTEGRITESSKKLLLALYDESTNDISYEIHKVIDIGSTSGTDFLFGIYCMMRLLSKKEA